MFNGAVLGQHRIQIGTVTGVLGIGVLQLLGLRGIASTIRAEAPRLFCARSATGFAVTGALAHLCCGSVILAYQAVSQMGAESRDGRWPSTRSATPLLAVSASGAFTALAIFGAGLTRDALGRQGNPPTSSMVVTPLPCVILTLLTFGALPAPGWRMGPAGLHEYRLGGVLRGHLSNRRELNGWVASVHTVPAGSQRASRLRQARRRNSR